MSPRADKFFALGSIGGISLSRMLYALLIARMTDPTVFAVFVVLITIEILAQTLLGALLVTPLVTMGPGLQEQDRPGFLRFAVARMTRFSAAVGLIAVAGMPVAAWLGQDPWMYGGFCAYVTFWVLNKGLAGAMAAKFRRVVSFAGDAIRLPIPLAALWIAHANQWPILTTFWWSAALGNVLACWLISRAVTGSASAPPSNALKLSYAQRGRRVLSGSIANSACSRVQPFVLGLANGALTVAQFGAANTLMGPIRIMGSALGDILQPRLAIHMAKDGDPQRARRALTTAGATLGLMLLALTAAVTFAGEWISDVVFGPKFAGLAPVLPWACLFVAVASAVSILVVVMQVVSLELTAYASKLRIYVSILSLGLVWPACALDGARGAFIAMLVAESVYLVFAAASLRSGTSASSTEAPAT